MRKGNLEDLQNILLNDDRVNLIIDFLKNTENLLKLQTGRIDIQGDDVFALIQHNKLKEFNNDLWEAHKIYYDIHYVFSGSESIAYRDISVMQNISEYNEGGDYWLFTGELDKTITLKDGELVVFEPNNVHQPGLTSVNVENAEIVKKVVVKVKIK